jgi:hypothetical protein
MATVHKSLRKSIEEPGSRRKQFLSKLPHDNCGNWRLPNQTAMDFNISGADKQWAVKGQARERKFGINFELTGTQAEL